jgi:aspartate/methionine/tyrosine aminotransferase
VQLVPYRLAYDGAWHIDFASLCLTASTRAIISVSPNNPTGNYLARSELHGLAQLGWPLISDEVFHEYPLQAGVPPRFDAPDCLTFRLGGLSKLAGLPQLKLGWTSISGPEAARREARERLELVADTFLSVGTPVQQALPELLALAPQITASLLVRCRHNLATLRRVAVGSPLSVLRAEGGWSAVVQPPKVQSEDELVTGLLRERQVLVQPGWLYDFATDPYAVVSLLTDPAVFAPGVERLVAHVTQVTG